MAQRAEATSSSGSSLARWVILLALGGAIALPYTARTVGQPPAAGEAPASDGSASSSSPTSSRSDDETAHIDAISLLGEFAGINASESGLLIAAARDAASIVPVRQPAATIDEVRAALIDLKNSAEPVTEANVGAVLATIIAARRSREVPPSASTAARGAAADEQKAIAARVVEFLHGDSEQLRIEQVVRAFAERNIDVEFLLATVPDPIDSNARWTFDAFVDSIERAAAASSFVLDRFYIPDWDRGRDDTSAHVSAPRRTHEQWPAVVLFRDANFGTDPSTRHVLVTSLISETPTSGIHHVAFTRAIRIGERWRAAVQKVQGLAAVTDTAVTRDGAELFRIDSVAAQRDPYVDPMPAEIRMVAGAATSVQSQNVEQAANPHVTFRTTVIPDRVVLHHTVAFLKDTDPLVDRDHRMAVCTRPTRPTAATRRPRRRCCRRCAAAGRSTMPASCRFRCTSRGCGAPRTPRAAARRRRRPCRRDSSACGSMTRARPPIRSPRSRRRRPRRRWSSCSRTSSTRSIASASPRSACSPPTRATSCSSPSRLRAPVRARGCSRSRAISSTCIPTTTATCSG